MAQGGSVKKLNIVQVALLILVFGALWFSYQYFQEQSLLSSGKTNAEIVVQQIVDGDQQGVKSRLLNFAGVSEDEAEDINELRIALINVDYVGTVVVDGVEPEFVGDFIETRNERTVYRAIYEIPAEQGGEDYIVVLLSRSDGKWVLSNLVLSATNPVSET